MNCLQSSICIALHIMLLRNEQRNAWRVSVYMRISVRDWLTDSQENITDTRGIAERHQHPVARAYSAGWLEAETATDDILWDVNSLLYVESSSILHRPNSLNYQGYWLFCSSRHSVSHSDWVDPELKVDCSGWVWFNMTNQYQRCSAVHMTTVCSSSSFSKKKKSINMESNQL